MGSLLIIGVDPFADGFSRIRARLENDTTAVNFPGEPTGWGQFSLVAQADGSLQTIAVHHGSVIGMDGGGLVIEFAFVQNIDWRYPWRFYVPPGTGWAPTNSGGPLIAMSWAGDSYPYVPEQGLSAGWTSRMPNIYTVASLGRVSQDVIQIVMSTAGGAIAPDAATVAANGTPALSVEYLGGGTYNATFPEFAAGAGGTLTIEGPWSPTWISPDGLFFPGYAGLMP
jgi:hypothetical protein